MSNVRKAVLITGSSSGIGRACVKQMNRSGWQVFATVRKAADAEKLRTESGEGVLPIIMVSQHLYTRHLPDPDLVVRTSGEMRLSNFLLWQLAYAEIYVTPTLWPDFRGVHLLEGIAEYQKRERRYGGLNHNDSHAPAETVKA